MVNWNPVEGMWRHVSGDRVAFESKEEGGVYISLSASHRSAILRDAKYSMEIIFDGRHEYFSPKQKQVIDWADATYWTYAPAKNNCCPEEEGRLLTLCLSDGGGVKKNIVIDLIVAARYEELVDGWIDKSLRCGDLIFNI